MKAEYLSKNNFLILDEICKNQRLCKLIYYSDTFPLEKPDITKTQMFSLQSKDNKLFPLPFPSGVEEYEDCQLRVWFGGGKIKNRVIMDNFVVFQFIMNNNLAIIGDENRDPTIRYNEVISEILKTFENKSIETVGILHFSGYTYRDTRSKNYTLYEVPAKMMTL